MDAKDPNYNKSRAEALLSETKRSLLTSSDRLNLAFHMLKAAYETMGVPLPEELKAPEMQPPEKLPEDAEPIPKTYIEAIERVKDLECELNATKRHLKGVIRDRDEERARADAAFKRVAELEKVVQEMSGALRTVGRTVEKLPAGPNSVLDEILGEGTVERMLKVAELRRQAKPDDKTLRISDNIDFFGLGRLLDMSKHHANRRLIHDKEGVPVGVECSVCRKGARLTSDLTAELGSWYQPVSTAPISGECVPPPKKVEEESKETAPAAEGPSAPPAETGGLWRSRLGKEKYLVLRRDGTKPTWPYFVIGARDPAAPSTLYAYSAFSAGQGRNSEFVEDVRALAKTFEQYRREHGPGDPDAVPHRKDDPAIVQMLNGNAVRIQWEVVESKAPWRVEPTSNGIGWHVLGSSGIPHADVYGCPDIFGTKEQAQAFADDWNRRCADQAEKREPAKPVPCARCGSAKEVGQVYCGAACSAMAEMKMPADAVEIGPVEKMPPEDAAKVREFLTSTVEARKPAEVACARCKHVHKKSTHCGTVSGSYRRGNYSVTDSCCCTVVQPMAEEKPIAEALPLEAQCCNPPHACNTHGRCWTHSTWDQKESAEENPRDEQFDEIESSCNVCGHVHYFKNKMIGPSEVPVCGAVVHNGDEFPHYCGCKVEKK